MTENPSTSIITAGDFNPSSNGFQTKIITKHCHLKQVVKHPTRQTANLDLILTNVYCLYNEPRVVAPIGTSDHCMIVWKSKEQSKGKIKTRKIIVRPTRTSSLQAFDQYTLLHDWSHIYNAISVIDAFLQSTVKMIDHLFPPKTIKVHESAKRFITGEIKSMISKRDKLYQQGRNDQFKILRNKIVTKIRKEKSRFYNKTIKPARCGNPKLWWNNIKRIIGRKQHCRQINIADHINSFFTILLATSRKWKIQYNTILY